MTDMIIVRAKARLDAMKRFAATDSAPQGTAGAVR